MKLDDRSTSIIRIGYVISNKNHNVPQDGECHLHQDTLKGLITCSETAQDYLNESVFSQVIFTSNTIIDVIGIKSGHQKYDFPDKLLIRRTCCPRFYKLIFYKYKIAWLCRAIWKRWTQVPFLPQANFAWSVLEDHFCGKCCTKFFNHGLYGNTIYSGNNFGQTMRQININQIIT